MTRSTSDVACLLFQRLIPLAFEQRCLLLSPAADDPRRRSNFTALLRFGVAVFAASRFHWFTACFRVPRP